MIQLHSLICAEITLASTPIVTSSKFGLYYCADRQLFRSAWQQVDCRYGRLKGDAGVKQLFSLKLLRILYIGTPGGINLDSSTASMYSMCKCVEALLIGSQ